MHAGQSESYWQKSEQEVLVSETGLWENRRYCCGVRRGDDDDTSLVSETVLWENRRYCCGVRRGDDDMMIMMVIRPWSVRPYCGRTGGTAVE